MECPKCKTEVTEEMLTCPNCKKVLKLVCPKCKTVNKTNTCRKCGFVIISRCHKCGKINQTINGKCSKCGFSTHTSVAIASSNIDEFACLTIEFPNIDVIKKALGSTKLTEKFKGNLDNLLLGHARSIGVSREIIENIYILRFNKDISFTASAKNAVKTAIEILNLITELNFKLKKLTSTTLNCNIAILKRDIYSKPSQYKSGFDIKLIYQNKKELALLNNLQIITDSYIYEKICEDYDLSSLSSKFIKDEMMTFFELNLKKYIKIKKPKEKVEEILPELPVLLENKIPEDNEKEIHFYGVDAINFNELKCTFDSASTLELPRKITEMFKKNRNQIVSIKGKEEFYPPTEEIIEVVEKTNSFKNIFRVTCHDQMKYRPYGFFYELISGIYNYSISPKNFGLNKFELFRELDSTGFIKSLINLEERTFPHPEDVRYSLFDIFFNIFRAMSNSLIYVENFEKIDDTSLEILQLIFEKFDEFHISFLILSDKDYSLHKNSYFLLGKRNYTEIRLKPSYVKDIIGTGAKFSKILDSYYIKTIVQNTRGSLLYFKHAMNYFIEKELITTDKDGAFLIEDFENVFIPPKLSELIQKRLQFLSKKDKNAYKMFALIILLGPKADLFTIKSLQIENEIESIKRLAEKNYIYVYNNTVYVQNFSILKEAFLLNLPQKLKQEFSAELIKKVFSSQIKHPTEIGLYQNLEQQKQEFVVWEKLSHVNASMGDFSAYLNCSVKLLKLLENNVNENSQKTIEDYKMEVYENISNLLYKYTPNEVYNISKVILENLEKTVNHKKIIEMCNKMLQGCLISGNYSYALELIHKILSKYSNVSMNPQDKNFDVSFFLISLIKIEVLFSIGDFKDCEEAGEEILEVLNLDNITELKPQNLSQKQFEEAIFDGLSFTVLAKVILLKSDSDIQSFIEKIQRNIGKTPNVFDLFLKLKSILNGEKIVVSPNLKVDNDKFSRIIFNFIKAFSLHKNDFNKFANNIYKSKIEAKMHKLSQFELLCDLLIGYSYFKLEKYEKAASIYRNALDISVRTGLKTVTYVDWYLISLLKFKENEIEIAYGIADNAIVQLEKDTNSGDFIFYLFRILLSKILFAKGDKESAEMCMKNAEFIKEKYGLM